MGAERESTRRRAAECGAVAATGLLHVVWIVAIGGGGGDIVVIGAAWLLYLAWRVRRDRTVLARWGLRREGLLPAALAAAALLLVGAGAIAAFAALRGTLRWNAHMLPLLALYPLWGWLQQLLMFGVFLTNLARTPHRLARFSRASAPDLFVGGSPPTRSGSKTGLLLDLERADSARTPCTTFRSVAHRRESAWIWKFTPRAARSGENSGPEQLAPRRRALAIAATILLFGLVHAPYWGLVAGTVALAAALTPLWLRWRNLWPLGLVHGWLGVLFYYLVLGRDVFAEVFGGR